MHPDPTAQSIALTNKNLSSSSSYSPPFRANVERVIDRMALGKRTVITLAIPFLFSFTDLTLLISFLLEVSLEVSNSIVLLKDNAPLLRGVSLFFCVPVCIWVRYCFTSLGASHSSGPQPIIVSFYQRIFKPGT